MTAHRRIYKLIYHLFSSIVCNMAFVLSYFTLSVSFLTMVFSIKSIHIVLIHWFNPIMSTHHCIARYGVQDLQNTKVVILHQWRNETKLLLLLLLSHFSRVRLCATP